MLLRKLKTAFLMPAADKVLLAQAWVELMVVEMRLRTWPFPRVQQRAARMLRSPVPGALSSSDWHAIRHYQRIVGLASRYHLFPMTCLRQTLTLQALLGKQGIPSDLRIGTRKEEGQLRAHAWLEVTGRPLQNRSGEVERFTILAPMDIER